MIGSALLLFSVASAQVPTTTALPYLLTDQAGVIKIVASAPLKTVPPAVAQSNIGGLLGGGFGAVFQSAFEPSQAAAQAAALAGVRAITIVNKAKAAQARIEQLNNDANQTLNQNQQKLENFDSECDESEFKARFRRKPGAAAPHRLAVNGASHTPQVAGSTHKWKRHDSVCMLPEEEQADEAETELETITESGDAAQEALEAAEETAEAAEAAAEAAEAAAEALVDGIDVLEGILEALAII